MSFGRIALLWFVVLSVSSCEQVESALGTDSADVLVVDMTAVIRATGIDVIMKQQLDEADNILSSQVKQAASDLNQQLSEAKTAAGEKPSDEKQQELLMLGQQANQQLAGVQRLAQEKLQGVRRSQLVQIREQLKPICERIAVERGAKVVRILDEPILWMDASVDITSEVITKVRAEPLTLDPLPPTTLPDEAGLPKHQ